MNTVRILIVEDDPDDRELIHLILEKALPNAFIKSTFELDEYKREVSEGNYDVVLTDYNIGDFTGFDVVNFIRTRQLDIPVILITGEYATETALDAIRLQVDDYVVKNFKYAKRLPKIIERVLKNSHIEYAKRTTTESISELVNSYSHIFDRSAELVLSLWPDGSILTVNRAWSDSLGYSKEEVAYININAIVAKESKEQFQQILKQIAEGKSDIPVKLIMNHKNGKKVYVEGSTSSRLVSGRAVASHWILRDVTHSKEIEKLLLDTDDQYVSAFEYAPNPMLLGDHRGVVMQINRAACELVGYSYDEMLGKHIKDITHPDDALTSLQEHARMMSGQIDSYTTNKRYLHKSGKYVPVVVEATLVRNDQKQPRFAIAQFKELTAEESANINTHNKSDTVSNQ